MIPAEVHLFVCKTCGRTDRFKRMGQQHYAAGKRCDGSVVRVRYVLDPKRPIQSDP